MKWTLNSKISLRNDRVADEDADLGDAGGRLDIDDLHISQKPQIALFAHGENNTTRVPSNAREPIVELGLVRRPVGPVASDQVKIVGPTEHERGVALQHGAQTDLIANEHRDSRMWPYAASG